MTSAVSLLREQVQTSLGSRCGPPFLLKEKQEETIPSVLGGIPRGALTEISGPPSSGRTSLLYSLLATSCSIPEFCALLDASDTFDPESAEAGGVRLSQILWVRCGGNVESALKAADLLAQGGGFGLVAIDLGDCPEKTLRRIPLAAWFRLRRGVENTRTALVVLARQMHAHSCSSLKIELNKSRSLWKGRLPGTILTGFEITAQTIRNRQMQESRFHIEA